MSEITVNLHDCKHCDGTGSCRNGINETSCIACAKRNELPFWRQKNQYGLLCGSCGGLGRAEPLTERMNKRIAPLLAMLLVVGLMVLVSLAAISNSSNFSELLAFSSAIIGTVAGFYFSNHAHTK
jgi:hypothetical protein